jgi:hypothetical protein
VCPATLEATAGQPCSVEGLACSPLYACGAVQATATCACEGGFFGCTDVTGRALAAGDVPACPAFDGGGTCPISERAAAIAACSEVGLLCAYPSACPTVRYLDQCECRPITTPSGATALRFDCGTPCPPAGAPAPGPDAATAFDAAPADSGLDSTTGSDAPVDSPSDSSPPPADAAGG